MHLSNAIILGVTLISPLVTALPGTLADLTVSHAPTAKINTERATAAMTASASVSGGFSINLDGLDPAALIGDGFQAVEGLLNGTDNLFGTFCSDFVHFLNVLTSQNDMDALAHECLGFVGSFISNNDLNLVIPPRINNTFTSLALGDILPGHSVAKFLDLCGHLDWNVIISGWFGLFSNFVRSINCNTVVKFWLNVLNGFVKMGSGWFGFGEVVKNLWCAS